MPRLIAALIRHGQYHQRPGAPSAHQPFPLTGEGSEQATGEALALSREIQAQGWQVAEEVDSSLLLRAWQTATIFAGVFAQQFPVAARVSAHADLAERCVGSAANLTMDEIEQVVAADPRFDTLPDDWKSNSHFCLPLQGAESLMNAGRRVADHILRRMAELESRVQEDTIKLFVGHGAAFRHAACHLGVLEFEEIARLSMYHAVPVLIERGPGQDWSRVGGRWKVRGAATAYTD